MPVVTFHNEYRSVDVEPGTNLRRLMRRVGVTPYRGLAMLTNCRGHNFCGTCAVEIVDGKGLAAPTDDELSTLGGNLLVARTVGKNVRLACQLKVNGDMVVKTHPVRPVDRQGTKQRIALFGLAAAFCVVFLGVLLFLFFDMFKRF